MTANAETGRAQRLEEVLELVQAKVAPEQRSTLEAFVRATTDRWTRRTWRSGRRPISTAPRCRTGTSRAGASRARSRARIQSDDRGARLAVDAHDHRDRQRRHAVPRRLGGDGGQPPRPDAAPHHPPDHRRRARRRRHADRRCRRRRRRAPRIVHPRRGRPHHRAGEARGARRRHRARARRRARGGRGLEEDAGRHGAVLQELDKRPPPLPADELAEGRAFLAWLADDHFTFLGYRCHDLVVIDGEDALAIVPGSSLGILREGENKEVATSFAALPAEVRAYARRPELLVVTKSNSRSTVHRPGYLDYIGVKRFDANGEVCGEHRFLGLFTSTAYSANPAEIPLLRRKVANVVARAGLAARQPRRQGADQHPRDLSARRAVPDRRGRAAAHGRSASCISASASASACSSGAIRSSASCPA